MLKQLRLFMPHLAGKKLLLAAMFLLGLAGAATSLATPLIGKTFIDEVAGKGNYRLVPLIAAGLIALAVSDLFIGGITRLVHLKLSSGVLVELRQRLFARCLHAPLAELEQYRHGDLLNRFGTDIPRIQTLLVDGLLGLLQNVIFLTVATIILLKLSLILTLWSFLGLFLALLITTAFRKPVENGTRIIREAMVDLSHFLTERLGALRAIRLHFAQETDREAFAGHNATLIRRLFRFQMIDTAASGLPPLMLTLILALIYLTGGKLIQQGEITLGTFVAFILYQGRLTAPAMGLLGLVRNLQEARVSIERVAELLETGTPAPAAVPACQPSPGSIDLQDIHFSYPEKPVILNGINLQVPAGGKIALFGSSGSGKSTLLQILFGLRRPARGVVTLLTAEDREKSVPPQQLLGFAGSDPFLTHASVADNLRYGNRFISDEALHQAAVLADAHGFITALPDGYATVIGGRGQTLSDGQRQRLGLARLILRNPGILVLDEAFSALDPETEAIVRRNLLRHFSDRTFLVITHRLHHLEDFDRLYLLQNGIIRQVDEQELKAVLGGNSTSAQGT